MTDDVIKSLMANIQKEPPLVDGDALESMAGKRIRDIYYLKSKDGSIKQLVLISTDLRGMVLTIGNNREEIFSSIVLNDKFSKSFKDADMNAVYSCTMDHFNKERVHQLFHTLWSKAGTSDYIKEEWKEFEEILQEAGLLPR